jgi:cold shock CspA family protein
MAPKVRVGVEYEIFYGLSKALNVGRRVKIRERSSPRHIGTVISVDTEKGFGFIRGGEQHTEFYFKISEFQEYGNHPPRVSQKVSFEAEVKYGKPRARSIKPQR